MKFVYLMVVVAMYLAGCAGSKSYEYVSEKYASAGELVQAEFPRPKYISFVQNGINPFHYNRLHAPYESLKEYCVSADQGQFQKLEAKMIRMGKDDINDLFGVFGCYAENGLAWVVDIGREFDSYRESYIAVRMVPAPQYIDAQKIKSAMREQEALFVDMARTRFHDLALKNKVPGERVCTADNYFGFVESAAGGNVKVNVRGRAIRMKMYGFFYNEDTNFFHTPLDEVNWYSQDKWAACSFSDPR